MKILNKIVKLLKDSNKEYVTYYGDDNYYFYLLRKKRDDDKFFEHTLFCDEKIEIGDNYYFCKRYLSYKKVADQFYVKKININDVIEILKNAAKDEKDLTELIKKFEEDEFYVVKADRGLEVEFPFNLF